MDTKVDLREKFIERLKQVALKYENTANEIDIISSRLEYDLDYIFCTDNLKVEAARCRKLAVHYAKVVALQEAELAAQRDCEGEKSEAASRDL
ncbi:hypothetical protein [Phyllobacterium sp. OV277]|uniref:hypothetical protein n=1 Tax=Phyllobacterium sp. OV277 TaxID=1882772 RepID=UPI00087E1B9E|nr:hypothetical protein [Phyllobacterium sp. OV277]SDP38648.1 hypothetical protein SAMN05443582_104411 [Phyllobacterium sp. OV277]